MSGFLVNLLRRSKVCALCNKSAEVPFRSLSLSRCISTTSFVIQKQSADQSKPSTDEDKKKKDAIKITLLGKGNSMSITSLEEAQKLSRRRNMKLVKVEDFDVKTERPVYQLLTASEFLAEEVTDKKSTSSAKKHEKLLSIGSRIAEHDLASRLKNITKWLEKGNEVRILIQGNGSNDPGVEKVYNAIDATVKEVNGRIVQKANKGGNLKFSIKPPTSTSSSSSSSGGGRSA